MSSGEAHTRVRFKVDEKHTPLEDRRAKHGWQFTGEVLWRDSMGRRGTQGKRRWMEAACPNPHCDGVAVFQAEDLEAALAELSPW